MFKKCIWNQNYIPTPNSKITKIWCDYEPDFDDKWGPINVDTGQVFSARHNAVVHREKAHEIKHYAKWQVDFALLALLMGNWPTKQ